MTYTLYANIKGKFISLDGNRERLTDELLGSLMDAYPTISQFWKLPDDFTSNDIRTVIHDEGLDEEVSFTLATKTPDTL